MAVDIVPFIRPPPTYETLYWFVIRTSDFLSSVGIIHRYSCKTIAWRQPITHLSRP